MKGVFIVLAILLSFASYSESRKCFTLITGSCKQILRTYRESLRSFYRLFREISQLITRVTMKIRALRTCSTKEMKCEKIEQRIEKKDGKIEVYKDKIMKLVKGSDRGKSFTRKVNKFIWKILALVDKQKTFESTREEHNCGRHCLMRLEEINDVFEMIDTRMSKWLGDVTHFLQLGQLRKECFERLVRKFYGVFRRAVKNYRRSMKYLRISFDLPGPYSKAWSSYNKRKLKTGALNDLGVVLAPMSGRIRQEIDYLIHEFETSYVPGVPETFEAEKAFFENLKTRDDLNDAIRYEIEDAIHEIAHEYDF